MIIAPPAKFPSEPCNAIPIANAIAPIVATSIDSLTIPNFITVAKTTPNFSIILIKSIEKCLKVSSTLKRFINLFNVLEINLTNQNPITNIAMAIKSLGTKSSAQEILLVAYFSKSALIVEGFAALVCSIIILNFAQK